MELMVAMGVTALIVVVLVSVTSIALDAWRRGRSEVRAARQAKAALDTMSRDLESLLVRAGNNHQWLFAKVEPNLSGGSSLAGPKGREMPNAAQLVFLNSATDRYDGKIGVAGEDRGGDVTATSYRLIYRDQIGDRDPGGGDSDLSVFALYRQLVNPDETFQSLLAAKDGLMTAWKAFEVKDTAPASYLVENIYELTVTFTVEYEDKATPGVSLTKRVPILDQGGSSVREFIITGNGLRLNPPDEAIASGRVVSVDLAITVLSDFGVQLAKKAREMDQERLIAEHGYHYSKSVMVPQP